MAIEHISDTAKWVAVYRAMETERPDAIFRDPFALRLAGVEGESIVDALPQGRRMAWTMIVRTAVFDDLVMRAIQDDGVDTVVNLAAGLDARPWRMDLPSGLRWFDVDLPGILDHKLSIMEAETPRCAYDARRVDLTDVASRRALFAEIGDSADRALVMTEGLLIYLTPEQVGSLADDLRSVESFSSWIIDLASPRVMQYIQRSWGDAVQKGNAPFKFAPEAGTAFFEPHGWREADYRSMGEEARRLRREMPGAWIWRIFGLLMSAKKKAEYQRMSGVVRLARA